MCSELFRIPPELFGVPLFGFGALLGLLWIGVGGWLAWKSSRGMPRSEALGFLPILAITSAVLFFLPRMFPEGPPIRGYGLMLILAFASAIGMAVHRARQNGLHPDVIFNLSVWLVVVGIIGARIFFVAQKWDSHFAVIRDPFERFLHIFQFTEGGLVVYGSLIGATIAFVVYCHRHKLPMLAMADIMAPSLVIGLALGRIGCLLNGCCYGGPADVSWAVTFPIGSPAYQDQHFAGKINGVHLTQENPNEPVRLHYAPAAGGAMLTTSIDAIDGHRVGSLVEAQRLLNTAYWRGQTTAFQLTNGKTVTARARSAPAHPTQVYSAVNGALLSWLTWVFYPFRRRDGQVIGLLLTLYPVSRFLLESIRIDEGQVLNTSLTISQNVSIAILVAMVFYWIWLYRQPAGLALQEALAGESGAPRKKSSKKAPDGRDRR